MERERRRVALGFLAAFENVPVRRLCRTQIGHVNASLRAVASGASVVEHLCVPQHNFRACLRLHILQFDNARQVLAEVVNVYVFLVFGDGNRADPVHDLHRSRYLRNQCADAYVGRLDRQRLLPRSGVEPSRRPAFHCCFIARVVCFSVENVVRLYRADVRVLPVGTGRERLPRAVRIVDDKLADECRRSSSVRRIGSDIPASSEHRTDCVVTAAYHRICHVVALVHDLFLVLRPARIKRAVASLHTVDVSLIKACRRREKLR